MRKCAYCGKRIGNNAAYGQLGSGLLLHHTKADCSMKAFRGKNLRARWFRLRNAFLYEWFKLNFFLNWIKYDFKNRRKKR